ncbi:MAG TPA: VWA domain-containing protein [Nevskiaceae bacterium]|nr:VWA domain-containing protein [Nevskiaceae bacterium]
MRPFMLQRGIILVTFVVSLLVLLLFFGMAVDVGFIYLARASLSKGTDAAALMAVRNISLGDAATTAIAQSTFDMNYQASSLPSRQVARPTVTVGYSLDSMGNKQVTVSATLQLNTFILGVIPDLARAQVSSSAQAARARLIMGIVLDRSGSMTTNGGSAALPPAVTTFINFFDDANDRASMDSFSDNARLDVAMGHNFKASITSKVKSMAFGGWTYSHGGIDIGRTQINSVALAPGENVVRVLVFFTDGQANSFLANNYPCTKTSSRSLVLVPGNGTSDFNDPATGNSVTCSSSTTKTFFSQKYNANRTRNTNNVTEEGSWMAEHSAQLLRGDGTLVFSIGLGTDIDKASLHRIANDASSTTYNPNQPIGVAAFAPTANDLDDVFRQIAAKILLRLTL